MDLFCDYTDNRGVIIPDSRINKLLSYIGKTELEVASFLGKEMMETDGAAYHFLDMLAIQREWYLSRGMR